MDKRKYKINLDLCNKAQNLAFITDSWSYLCKICKPLVHELKNNEYFKFKWYGNSVIFFVENNKLHKEINHLH